MGILGKDQILAAPDLKTTEVEVPEWGGTVRLRALSALDVSRFLEARDADGEVSLKGLGTLVALSAVDEAGNRLFGASDVDALLGKSHAAVERLAREALALNGMHRDGAEEAEKN